MSLQSKLRQDENLLGGKAMKRAPTSAGEHHNNPDAYCSLELAMLVRNPSCTLPFGWRRLFLRRFFSFPFTGTGVNAFPRGQHGGTRGNFYFYKKLLNRCQRLPNFVSKEKQPTHWSCPQAR
eukprot:917461-Pelagomonas_calceolata.AAC.8